MHERASYLRACVMLMFAHYDVYGIWFFYVITYKSHEKAKNVHQSVFFPTSILAFSPKPIYYLFYYYILQVKSKVVNAFWWTNL